MNQTEVRSLSCLVSQFGEVMRAKLWKKLEQGFKRWDDTSDPEVFENLQDKLIEHLNKYFKGSIKIEYIGARTSGFGMPRENETDPKQLVDIANLTAMLWHWHIERKEL